MDVGSPIRPSPWRALLQQDWRIWALLAVAVFCGPARLIDNAVLGEDPAPVGEAG